MPGTCMSGLYRFGIRQRYVSTRSKGIFSFVLLIRSSRFSALPVLPAPSQDLVQGFNFVGAHFSSMPIHVLMLLFPLAPSERSVYQVIITWHHDTPSHENEANAILHSDLRD